MSRPSPAKADASAPATASAVAPDQLRVPQESGEITVAVAGGPPVTFTVTGGLITIDPDDVSLRIGGFSTLETLVRSIPGAELVEA